MNLSFAVLCLDCNEVWHVFDSRWCPKCASRSKVTLALWVDRDVMKPVEVR